MTEEKAKSLIGRKVRGFKFEDGTDGVGYVYSMDKHIDEIGEIKEYSSVNSVEVEFKNDFWYYPPSLIEAHLVDENESEKSEIEQLKAENAELVEFIKTYYRYLNLKDQELAIKLLEKHGK